MQKIITDFSHKIIVEEDGVKEQGEEIIINARMEKYIDHVLVSKASIRHRIKALAREIAEHYGNIRILKCVVILKGSILFFADLIRELGKYFPQVKYDTIIAKSYINDESAGKLLILQDVVMTIKDRDILLVEDIIDTGLTLSRIKEKMVERGARSVKICTLLDKPSRREKNVQPDFVGFEIPNYFVAGYGLDYNQSFRALPYVVKLKDEVFNKK